VRLLICRVPACDIAGCLGLALERCQSNAMWSPSRGTFTWTLKDCFPVDVLRSRPQRGGCGAGGWAWLKDRNGQTNQGRRRRKIIMMLKDMLAPTYVQMLGALAAWLRKVDEKGQEVAQTLLTA